GQRPSSRLYYVPPAGHAGSVLPPPAAGGRHHRSFAVPVIGRKPADLTILGGQHSPPNARIAGTGSATRTFSRWPSSRTVRRAARIASDGRNRLQDQLPVACRVRPGHLKHVRLGLRAGP